MARKRTKVFISSSMGELAEERGIVRDAILDMKLEPFAYEDDAVASAAKPMDVWEQDLESSQICLVMLWRKLGKWTEAEVMFALERQIPVLMFVKVGDVDGDGDVEPQSSEVEAFLEPLTDPGTGVLAPKWFREADELTEDVTVAILHHMAQAQEDARRAKIDAGAPVQGGGRRLEESAGGHGAVASEARRMKSTARATAAVRRLGRYKGTFVGRDRDLRRFTGLVKQGESFIPVTGPDGMGRKTLLGVATHAELEGDFADGVGVLPEQSAGEDVEDVLTSVWEAFFEVDGQGVEVRRRAKDLQGLAALVTLLDVDFDDDQIEALTVALPGSVVAATMTDDVEISGRKLSLGPLTEPDDLVEVFVERAMIEVPADLRDDVAAACAATGGAPGTVVAFGDAAFNDDIDATTLADWLATADES